MLTQIQKNEILELIESEKERLGTYVAVAKKCGVSEATISQLRKGTYAAEGDDIYHTIALKLAYDIISPSEWNIVETMDYRTITETLNDAREKSMFIIISQNAGSGKTAVTKDYVSKHKGQKVFRISCRRWSERKFLSELANEINAEIPRGYYSSDDLIVSICETFNKMSRLKPLLIIDQANSLKQSAFYSFIDIYNLCEKRLGVVATGTENLEHELKRGARLLRYGYNEVNSRFGSKFVHLAGATLADVRKICEANGVSDKEMQSFIFNDSEPVQILREDGRSVRVIRDLRRLERVIIRELLKQEGNGNN